MSHTDQHIELVAHRASPVNEINALFTNIIVKRACKPDQFCYPLYANQGGRELQDWVNALLEIHKNTVANEARCITKDFDGDPDAEEYLRQLSQFQKAWATHNEMTEAQAHEKLAQDEKKRGAVASVLPGAHTEQVREPPTSDSSADSDNDESSNDDEELKKSKKKRKRSTFEQDWAQIQKVATKRKKKKKEQREEKAKQRVARVQALKQQRDEDQKIQREQMQALQARQAHGKLHRH